MVFCIILDHFFIKSPSKPVENDDYDSTKHISSPLEHTSLFRCVIYSSRLTIHSNSSDDVLNTSFASSECTVAAAEHISLISIPMALHDDHIYDNESNKYLDRQVNELLQPVQQLPPKKEVCVSFNKHITLY